MIKNTLAIITIIIVTIMTSCKGGKNQKEIAQIDSLRTMLVNTQNVFKQVDSEDVAEYNEKIEQQMKIFRLVSGDSIDKKTSVKFVQYYNLTRAFAPFLKKYPVYSGDIKYSFNQLDNLKKDVSDGNIDKQKFKKYFASEQSAVVQLSSAVDLDMNSVLTATKRYKAQKEGMEDLLDSLKKIHPVNDSDLKKLKPIKDDDD